MNSVSARVTMVLLVESHRNLPCLPARRSGSWKWRSIDAFVANETCYADAPQAPSYHIPTESVDMFSKITYYVVIKK